MYLPISIRSISTVILILLAGVAAMAQDESAEASPILEVRMYLVLGSDAAVAGSAIPKVLENTVTALRRDVSHKKFALLDVQMGRMADRGTIESRGVLDIRQSAFPGHPVYSSFQITDARSVDAAAPIILGTVQSQLKIPVRSVSGPVGTTAVVNYENIGYIGRRVSVASGVPTVVGSYSLPSDGATVYVVLTATRFAN